MRLLMQLRKLLLGPWLREVALIRNYFLGLAVVGLSLADATADAFADAAPEGSYAGAVSGGNSHVRVDAQFANQSASLHFGEPYNCRLAAVQREISGESVRYVFRPPPNGGAFCERLADKVLVVKTSGSSAFISFAQGGVEWSGNLEK